MKLTDKYYRVEQSEEGNRRAILCGATSKEYANARLNSIVENMLANGWRRKDEELIKKLTTVVMLTNGTRTVTLAVVECSADDIIETRRELAEMPWLVRTIDIDGDADTRELAVANADETPTEGLVDWLRDGADDYASDEQNARAS